MYRCLRGLLSVTALLIISQANAQVKSLEPMATDLAGVSLGMDVAQVRTALKQFNPAFVLTDSQYQARPGIPVSVGAIYACDGQLVGAAVCTSRDPGNPAGVDKVIVAFGQVTGKAFYISRSWYPAMDKRPLFSETKAAVLEKYGTNSKVREVGKEQARFTWPSDEDGAFDEQMLNRGCQYSSFEQVPRRASGGCTVVAAIQIDAARDRGQENLVSMLAAHLFDQRLLFDDIKKGNAATEAASAAERIKNDAAAKNNKPKL